MRPRSLVAALLAVALVGGVPLLPASAASPAPDEGPASPAVGGLDLATHPARRWIVQLTEPPVARYGGGIAGLQATAPAATGSRRLDAGSPDARAYADHLAARQREVEARLASAAPRARVQRRYRVSLNGIAVAMDAAEAAAARRLPGVRSVTPDLPFRLEMFSTPAQIGAPALWAELGGQASAGEGVKVAIIDSGIFVRRDSTGAYAGNPCFDDTGYAPMPGFPKGDARFTNNKVIVARAYFRPDDPPAPGDDTPIQGPGGSPHGTHVSGTVACNAGTAVSFQGANVTISGVAPRARLMNYRVFYPSSSLEDFQNGNAYTVELVQAIEDAVADGADVVSNSWGSSYQNTLAWPDPMIRAAEAAVDAGVVMVFANGNAGPDTGTVVSPAISPKVIGVGAVTKNATIVPGDVDVTAPAPVPPSLTGMAVGPALFGPQVTGTVGPAPFVPAQAVATNASSLGCSLAGDASPYPAGSLAGRIALVQRGVCTFSEKVFNAQRGGAVAALVYNSAAGGDNLQAMGPGAHAAEVTISSWFMRRSDGLAMVSFATANPGTATARFTFNPHPASNVGDVMAGFSSRGPTQDKLLKPDVVAPGVDVLSGGYAVGDFPAPFTGFGSVSGTSMATPHVAGAAALLLQLHPKWKPGQVKSALMSTATEGVFLSTTLTARAGVLARGAGRIDLTRAGDPGLTIEPQSLSAGELAAGRSVAFTLRLDNESGQAAAWDVAATASPGLTVAPGAASVTLKRNGKVEIPVAVGTAPGAANGDYQGSVVLTEAATGRRLHVPVWLRVVPAAPTVDVLLVDDDGSSAGVGFADYSAVYTGLLDSLAVSYDYLDIWNEGFPSPSGLFRYRAVVVFTGDNDSFDTSGFFPSDQDRLAEWLDSGGRLWTTGQNFAEESDSNVSFDSESLGRARLYHGYLGIRYEAGSVYPSAAPRPTAGGLGPMAGLVVDLSPGADGAGNQSSIEASSPMPDNDTYQAAGTVVPFFRQFGGGAPAGSAVSFGRSPEPSLEEERLPFRYRSASMGFGLEGVNSSTGFAGRMQVAGRTLDWLLDEVTASVAMTSVTKAKQVQLAATASSSAGAAITGYRWDFGDGTPATTTSGATAVHRYQAFGTYRARVEATDALGHRTVAGTTIQIGP